MNIPRYIGRRLKDATGWLVAVVVKIAIIAAGVAAGILIAAPFL